MAIDEGEIMENETQALREGFDPIEVCCDDWKPWTKEAEDEYKRGSVAE